MYMRDVSAICSLLHPNGKLELRASARLRNDGLSSFIADGFKQDGNKAPQHGQISKQPLDCILNFFILSHFPNEHNVGATAVKDGS